MKVEVNTSWRWSSCRQYLQYVSKGESSTKFCNISNIINGTYDDKAIKA
jgi:hypothetical protein